MTDTTASIAERPENGIGTAETPETPVAGGETPVAGGETPVAGGETPVTGGADAAPGAGTGGGSGATAPEPGPDASGEGGDAPGVPDAPEAPEPAEPLPTDEERLALYLRAERAILLGHQSYSIEGLTYTRADLGRVQAVIASLRARLAARQASASGAGWGGVRTVGVRF